MEYIWNPTDWLQTEAANADSLFISIKIIDKGISPQNVQSWGKNWPKVIFREVQDTVPFLAALVQVKHFSREQILSFEASRWKEVSVTNVSYAVTFLFFIIFFCWFCFHIWKCLIGLFLSWKMNLFIYCGVIYVQDLRSSLNFYQSRCSRCLLINKQSQELCEGWNL